jgi:hypothetical protein
VHANKAGAGAAVAGAEGEGMGARDWIASGQHTRKQGIWGRNPLTGGVMQRCGG